MARHAFPLWAGLLILIRDGVVLAAAAALAFGPSIRIDVRWVGKVATLGLMCGVPLVAWANFGLAAAGPARVVGWVAFWGGIVLAYAAAGAYAIDVRRELAGRSRDRPPA
jgi:phosphatidylglycerophosphate synthase